MGLPSLELAAHLDPRRLLHALRKDQHHHQLARDDCEQGDQGSQRPQHPRQPPARCGSHVMVCTFLVVSLLGVATGSRLYWRWQQAANPAPKIKLRPCPQYEGAPSASDNHTAAGGGGAPLIPRILHQTAKDPSRLPPLWAANQATWRANHPSWQYRMWDDAANQALAEASFPWFLATYNGFRNPILKVDCARYMYMYLHGGVYVDLDTESLRPLEPLLAGRELVLGVMGDDLGFPHSIPNAFLASAPGHPFWLHLLWSIKAKASGAWALRGNRGEVEAITGPIMLRAALRSLYPDSAGCRLRAAGGHSVFLAPGGALFPFNWADKGSPRLYDLCYAGRPTTFDPAACRRHFPDAFAVSYWTHSWGNNRLA